MSFLCCLVVFSFFSCWELGGQLGDATDYGEIPVVRNVQESTASEWPSSSWVADQEGDTSFSCRTREDVVGPFGWLRSSPGQWTCERHFCEVNNAKTPTSLVFPNFMSDRRVRGTNILVSLAADPPAIFCTRRVRRSCLSSANCFVKSALFLSRRSDDNRVKIR